MTTIQFSRLARNELREAIRTYETEVEGLGAEFLDEVTNGLEVLRRFPRIAPIVSGSIRALVLARFPYTLIYRCPAEGKIRILAVAHQKRRFGYWRGRR